MHMINTINNYNFLHIQKLFSKSYVARHVFPQFQVPALFYRTGTSMFWEIWEEIYCALYLALLHGVIYMLPETANSASFGLHFFLGLI